MAEFQQLNPYLPLKNTLAMVGSGPQRAPVDGMRRHLELCEACHRRKRSKGPHTRMMRLGLTRDRFSSRRRALSQWRISPKWPSRLGGGSIGDSLTASGLLPAPKECSRLPSTALVLSKLLRGLSPFPVKPIV